MLGMVELLESGRLVFLESPSSHLRFTNEWFTEHILLILSEWKDFRAKIRLFDYSFNYDYFLKNSNHLYIMNIYIVNPTQVLGAQYYS